MALYKGGFLRVPINARLASEEAAHVLADAATLDQVIHQVEVPAARSDKPYLRPLYDHPQFLVRSVWRRYGGWCDGEPDNLLPAPRSGAGPGVGGLAGGTATVLRRAEELAGSGDVRLACHLVEFAVLAEPDSTAAHHLRTAIYAARATEQESSIARNILAHAAKASRQMV